MERAELLARLCGRILALQKPHPLRVAVDGVDAAGKTTLADALASALASAAADARAASLAPTGRPVIRATIDQFHNPREIRYRQGAESPKGYYEDSFDLAALKRLLLDPLGPGGTRSIQTALFDYRSDAPAASAPFQAAPQSVLIFDGIFLLRPELADCWDLSIFLQVPFETVLARAVERDSAWLGGNQAVIERYMQKYIPAQRAYLAACRPAELADVLIDNQDPDHPQLLRL